MRCLRQLFLVSLAVTAWALHESDVGVVDWNTKLIGVPLHGSPHTAPKFFGDYVLTATSNNVLAALNATDGSIGMLRAVSPTPASLMRLQYGEVYMMQRIRLWSSATMMIVRHYVDFKCAYESNMVLGVSSLSGPGGSTLRTYDLKTGHLILEKQLHSPVDGRLHEPQNLGISLLLSTDSSLNSTAYFALTNGDSVTRLDEAGKTLWTWSSPDQGCVYSYYAVFTSLISVHQVLSFVFSHNHRPFHGICCGAREVICILHFARNDLVGDHG
jgi:hypothetical protein